jgi:hypothetical protein
MGRKRVGKCAFCGEHGEITREHFVPQGLWSGKRPARTETVPTCKECNHGSHLDDEHFRNTLVLMLGEHPEKEQLLEGQVRRSLEQHPGWIKEMLEGSEERPLHTPSGIWLGNYPTLKFDLNRFERNLRRVTLGLFYLIRKQPFPATGKIGILGQLDQQTKPLIDLLEANFTPTFDFGDDVFEWRFLQTRWGFSAWKLAFYRSVVFYSLAFETPLEELESNSLNIAAILSDA